MKISLLEEIKKPENENRIVTIGNKEDSVYAFTVLNKLLTYDYIFVRVFALPELLSRVNYIYTVLVSYGVVRLAKPEKTMAQNNHGKVDVIIFKWEIIPRIKGWRESLKKDDFLTIG